MSLPREQVCKGCSLVVQPGYPKCPRCKMPLPMVETPLAKTTKASQVKGGTAIEAESSSAMFFVAGGIVLAGIVVAVLVLGRDDDDSATEASETVEASPRIANETRVDTSAGPDPSIGISLDSEEPGNDEQRSRALRQLDQDLSEARLWSTVSVVAGEDAVISVVSSACEQEAMQPTLLAAAESLRTVGFASIRCEAKHGAQLFELDF